MRSRIMAEQVERFDREMERIHQWIEEARELALTARSQPGKQINQPHAHSHRRPRRKRRHAA